jgi:hypothetical protein
MTEEDEEFNRIEMESRIKQDYVRDIKKPSREALMAEVTVLTELVRVLSAKVADMEAKHEQDDTFWAGIARRQADRIKELEAVLKQKNI